MKYFLLSVVLALIAFVPSALAQNCQPPAVLYNAKNENLFTPEQETYLGELIIQGGYTDLRFVRDPEALAFVEAVGASIVKQLPPTGLKFKFHIVDIPDANAFNIPGGHVFLSRKLIASLKNEDELAGVIAHEMGHAAVHHASTNFSLRLRKILNVTTIGDRKDIAQKYNLLIENARTRKVSWSEGHESEQQVEADRIGIFAVVAAGYQASSFFTFFDRLTESKGKTGSWFSDIFGKTTPNQKRLREMGRLTEQLPAECRQSRTRGTQESFLKWQADVIFFRDEDRRENLTGLLWKREMTPKLRSDVSRLLVSANGRYVVTQDDFSLTVLEREPLKIAFQIPAEDVEEVYVTSDEQHIVFITSNLRFEKWSIADQRPIEVREMVLRRDCVESKLSQDGNYLACIDTSLAANIIFVPTGERVFQKKGFYELNWNEYWRWVSNFNDDTRPFFRIEFTPGPRAVIFSRSNFFRADETRLSVGSRYATYDTTLAVDLATRKPFDVGGEMDKVLSRAYAFVDGNRILGMGSADAPDGGIFSFPDGKRVSRFGFYANEIEPTGNPDYFVIRPLQSTTMGIFDVKASQIALGLNKEDAAIWKNQFIFESAGGKIVVRDMTGAGKSTRIDGADVTTIDLPSASIGRLSASEVSNNFNWLALSSRTRGGVWNLANGVRQLHVTGFRGGIVADDGGAVAEFPKFEEENHSLVLMNSAAKSVGVIKDLPPAGAKQFGRFVLSRISLDRKPAAEKKDDKKIADTRPKFDDVGENLRQNVRYELRDFLQDKVIWSRDFPKDSPLYAFDEFSGRLMLYWHLGTDAGKQKLKEDPALKTKAEALGNKESDYLIEVIDAFSGKHLGNLFLETGKGSFYVGGGMSEGDLVVLFDSEERVLVYSLSTGALLHRFFGSKAALSPAGKHLAVENFPGEVTVYDLTTGDSRGSVTVRGRAAFVRFNLEGTRLFILSNQQTAYAFDVNKITHRANP